jgi:hypothetical protein
MTQNFSSVTLFYVAIRNFLLSEGGMSIERTLGLHDIVLTAPTGFVRLRMEVVSSEVSCICITLGADADVLAVTPEDPETCLPFNTTTPSEFYGLVELREGVLQFLIAATVGHRSYRASFNFALGRVDVQHNNPPSNEYSPNFGVSGGPYIESGA